MEIIHEPRRAGKTTKLIEMLEKNDQSNLLVFSSNEKKRLINLYPHFKNRIIALEDFASGMYRGTAVERGDLLIDNLDLMLNALLRYRGFIKAVSINKGY